MKLNLGHADKKNESFIQLNVKSMMLIIPAIILGHYIDTVIEKLRLNKYKSVTLQTFLNIFIIYVLHRININYAKEFQMTLAGLFFSALFFGMQTNYIRNIKLILNY